MVKIQPEHDGQHWAGVDKAADDLRRLVFYRVRGVAAPHWQRSRESSAALYGELEELLGGIADIRSSGASGYVLRRFAQRLRDNFLLTRRAGSISVGVGQAAGLVLGLGGVGILACPRCGTGPGR